MKWGDIFRKISRIFWSLQKQIQRTMQNDITLTSQENFSSMSIICEILEQSQSVVVTIGHPQVCYITAG